MTEQELPLYRPEDFYTGAPPRIMGDEIELRSSTTHTVSRMPWGAVDRFAPNNFRPVARLIWLANGASFIDDVSQMEGRCAESVGPLDAAISLRALIAGASDLMGAAYPRDPSVPGLGATLHYHAGSYDHRLPETKNKLRAPYQTRGFQLNLLAPVPRPEDQLRIETLLTGHTVTAAWAGAGALHGNGFRFFQRDTLGDLNASTARDREVPIAIHYSDHARNDTTPPGFVRVERRIGEALRATGVDVTQKAAASLILRVIEHQNIFTPRERTRLIGSMPRNALRCLETVSADLSLRKTNICLDGDRRTAINIQEILLNSVRKVMEEVELPWDERQAPDRWQHYLDLLRACNPEKGEVDGAADELQFAFRLLALARHTEEPVVHWTGRDAALNSYSLGMDMTHPYDFMAGFARSTARGIMTEDEVLGRKSTPPRSRAAVRNLAISRHNDAADPLSLRNITWNTLKWKIHGKDDQADIHPYATTLPAFQLSS
jgi:hypothetical protein